MANITRFDPFGELARLDPFRDFESMFRLPRAAWRNMPEVPEIRMDVSEDEKGYRVKAEVPGVKKEDIDVRIEGNLVTISCEMKKEWDDRKEGRLLRSERQYGYTTRSFTLGSPVDEAKADAKYENGVLELTLPKKSATAT